MQLTFYGKPGVEIPAGTLVALDGNGNAVFATEHSTTLVGYTLDPESVQVGVMFLDLRRSLWSIIQDDD